jgi:hypothetical protein
MDDYTALGVPFRPILGDFELYTPDTCYISQQSDLKKQSQKQKENKR